MARDPLRARRQADRPRARRGGRRLAQRSSACSSGPRRPARRAKLDAHLDGLHACARRRQRRPAAVARHEAGEAMRETYRRHAWRTRAPTYARQAAPVGERQGVAR